MTVFFLLVLKVGEKFLLAKIYSVLHCPKIICLCAVHFIERKQSNLQSDKRAE